MEEVFVYWHREKLKREDGERRRIQSSCLKGPVLVYLERYPREDEGCRSNSGLRKGSKRFQGPYNVVVGSIRNAARGRRYFLRRQGIGEYNIARLPDCICKQDIVIDVT